MLEGRKYEKEKINFTIDHYFNWNNSFRRLLFIKKRKTKGK